MATTPIQDPRVGPPRIPLVTSMENRGTSVRQDARLVNAFAEKTGAGELHVYKRPGTAVHTTLSGAGRGVFNWNGDIFAVFGAALYKNGVSLGAVTATGGNFTFSSTLGETPTLFLKNTTNAYTYNTTDGLDAVAAATTYSVTGDTHTSTTIDGILPNTTGLVADASIEGSGIAAFTYIVSVDSASAITISEATTSTVNDTPLTIITPGYNAATVPGQVYLDATTYVMDSSARIYGSELNDCTTWDALNNLVAQIEPDGGVALAKQLVYVVAFKEFSTEVFFDKANAVGSPLGTVQGAKVNYGCRDAGTVQDLDGTLIWVSKTKNGTLAVHSLDGLKAQQVSHPAVDRLLHASTFTGCYSLAVKLGGHKFYILTLPASNLTLVLEPTSGIWSQWTDADGNYFPFVSAAATSAQEVLLQHEDDGKLYTLSMGNTNDAGSVIPVDIYTPNWDGQTSRGKYVRRLDFVGDHTPGCVLFVRTNDFDYRADRWTNYRMVDMGEQRPNLREGGTFSRRAFHIHHIADTALRLEAIEAHLLLGDI